MYRHTLVGLALTVTLGCGGSEPRPVTVAAQAVPAPPPPIEPARAPDPHAANEPGSTAGDAAPPACGETSGMRGLGATIAPVRTCYGNALSSERNRGSGKVSFRIVVDPSGNPTSVSVASSTLNDATLEACIASVLRSVHYPCVQGEITVPFVLAPGPRAQASIHP